MEEIRNILSKFYETKTDKFELHSLYEEYQQVLDTCHKIKEYFIEFKDLISEYDIPENVLFSLELKGDNEISLIKLNKHKILFNIEVSIPRKECGRTMLLEISITKEDVYMSYYEIVVDSFDLIGHSEFKLSPKLSKEKFDSIARSVTNPDIFKSFTNTALKQFTYLFDNFDKVVATLLNDYFKSSPLTNNISNNTVL